MLTTLSDIRPEIHGLPGARLKRVTDHVREHLDQNLTLAQLSAVVHMSPYHFARLFRHSTGLPPHRFVVRTRIERAARLLETSDMSIAHVGRLVGFRTPGHFSTVFRRLKNVTPRWYREKYLQSDGLNREEARTRPSRAAQARSGRWPVDRSSLSIGTSAGNMVSSISRDTKGEIRR